MVMLTGTALLLGDRDRGRTSVEAEGEGVGGCDGERASLEAEGEGVGGCDGGLLMACTVLGEDGGGDSRTLSWVELTG